MECWVFLVALSVPIICAGNTQVSSMVDLSAPLVKNVGTCMPKCSSLNLPICCVLEQAGSHVRICLPLCLCVCLSVTLSQFFSVSVCICLSVSPLARSNSFCAGVQPQMGWRKIGWQVLCSGDSPDFWILVKRLDYYLFGLSNTCFFLETPQHDFALFTFSSMVSAFLHKTPVLFLYCCAHQA